jgi:DNA-binding MarR family transcriptional regulator
METLEADLEKLETAMRLYIQTIKRPQQWANITAQAGVNLDRPAAYILHTLMLPRPQGWRVQDLAAQLGIEAPSVTRKTQELEAAGYLQRTRNPLDKRAIGLRLTPRGRTVTTRLWKIQRQGIARVLEQWPASERRQFVELFQRFSTDLAAQQTNQKIVL